MLKDTKEGKTHYQNDGCGMSEHNTQQSEEWEKELKRLLNALDDASDNQNVYSDERVVYPSSNQPVRKL